jgi:Uncharacterized protein conserved in bacteria (DUF2252)
VRGSTIKFYEWLESSSRSKIPEGPPVWICGDCHVGNSDLAKNHKASLEAPFVVVGECRICGRNLVACIEDASGEGLEHAKQDVYGAIPKVAAQAIRRTAGHSPAQA